MSFAQQLANCRVLPVIVAHDVKSTVRLAQALQNGGMRAVEITLRTPAALDSLLRQPRYNRRLVTGGQRAGHAISSGGGHSL
jgi:2-keto-3-deoxy-6-phosphogluconate aldolase